MLCCCCCVIALHFVWFSESHSWNSWSLSFEKCTQTHTHKQTISVEVCICIRAVNLVLLVHLFADEMAHAHTSILKHSLAVGIFVLGISRIRFSFLHTFTNKGKKECNKIVVVMHIKIRKTTREFIYSPLWIFLKSRNNKN